MANHPNEDVSIVVLNTPSFFMEVNEYNSAVFLLSTRLEHDGTVSEVVSTPMTVSEAQALIDALHVAIRKANGIRF